MNMRFMSCMLLVVMAIGIDVRAAQNPADALVRAIRGRDPVDKSLALAIQLVEDRSQNPQSLKKYLSEKLESGSFAIPRVGASYQALVKVKGYLDGKIAAKADAGKRVVRPGRPAAQPEAAMQALHAMIISLNNYFNAIKIRRVTLQEKDVTQRLFEDAESVMGFHKHELGEHAILIRMLGQLYRDAGKRFTPYVMSSAARIINHELGLTK